MPLVASSVFDSRTEPFSLPVSSLKLAFRQLMNSAFRPDYCVPRVGAAGIIGSKL